MKKILIIMAGVFVLACNSGKEKEVEVEVKFSDLVAEGLKGDISAIEEYPYTIDSAGNAGKMDSCCILINNYDENGNKSGWISKDSKGKLQQEELTTRYPNGMWQNQKFIKDGKTTYAVEAQMDDKNQYTVINEYNSSGKLENYYTEITQNEVGQILGWKQYDKDSVFKGVGETHYDKYLKTGFTLKDTLGKIISSYIIKYNENGEQIERTNTNVLKDSTVTTVIEYSYESHDEMGNWTQRTTLDDKGKPTFITKRVYKYRKKEEKN